MAGPSVSTGTVEFELREDGVLLGVALPLRAQSIEDARENLEAARQLSGGRPVPLLLDIRNTGTLARDARELYAGPAGAEVITALAFVGNSAFSRVVGNLFIRLADTRFPVRIFPTQEEALTWLNGSPG